VRELVERIVADAESIVNGRLAAMASTGPESCADDD
jgi:hypothetical protein